LTTATFHTQKTTFDKLNPQFDKSPILPQSTYFGSTPKAGEDPFMKRKVKQLNDIDLIEDKEPEAISNLKRMPKRILTEENLVAVLSSETEKLNLENHYWLSLALISKIGMMAPNLKELSLRRMGNITNLAFSDIFRCLVNLETVDLSDCLGLNSSALTLMVKKNPNIEDLQVNGCVNAVDDQAMLAIAGLKHLTFLDISYSKHLTDEGCKHFETSKLQSVIMN
jgi:hypothetical protein